MDLSELDMKDGETIRQFIYKLGKNKDRLNLSWQDISDMVLSYYNKVLSCDYIRHMYYGMVDRDIIDDDDDKTYIKVLVMNDLHIPHIREDVLDEIAKHKNLKYVIFGGDLIDVESCSFWDSWNRPSVEEELVLAHDFISKVNTIINPEETEIISILGNHEKRYERDIMKMQEKQLQRMLNPKLLSMLEKGFTYYENTRDITYKPIPNFKYIDNWYVKLFNNLIVAHPIDFSNVEGSICFKVADYFLNAHIAEQNDIIITGHTHKHFAGKVNRRQGVYVIENSCMCLPMDYVNNGKLKYTPQNYGYTVLKFKPNNKINLNDIQLVYLD